MATYTTSKRIIAKYKKPDDKYSGFGPIGLKEPKCVRIHAIMWKWKRANPNAKRRMYFMLTAVA